MVRIKFTGPGSAALQMQSGPTTALYTLASESFAPAQPKSQHAIAQRPLLSQEEQQSLKQQQSLEMVQIMLHVSFGTLFYLREFLPLACFDDRDLKQAQKERKFSYKEFINGKARSDKLPDPAFGQGKRGQPLKVITRNSDPKADMLLDVLERGIFDALSRNVLEAIQLTILVDKNKPSNVLESYTFSFKYSGSAGDVNRRLESLSLDPVGCIADMKTAQSARAGLEMIVRRLITLSAFLPTLPNKRSLGIHLIYNDDCPCEYEPPGFATSSSDIINYPLNEDWKKESQSCGVMDSGCHTVGLKVTSLKWIGPEPEGSEEPPKIPQDIEYRDAVPRAADIGFIDDMSAHNDRGNQNGDSQEATQDITERQKLQMMIPTQRTSPSPDSDLIPTQPVNHKAISGMGGDVSGDTSRVVILSPGKASRISRSIESGLRPIAASQDRQIRCQCAWNGDDHVMIECAFCHTFQHPLCYGFEGSNDSRIPDIHTCYECLLWPGESQLLSEMNTLVLLRKALGIILTEGFPQKASMLTRKLHCNGNTTVQVIDILKKRGFIQPTPGYKRKGFPQSGLPKYHLVHAADINKRMQTEVFDPLVKIKHHYFIQQIDEPSGVAKDAHALDSNNTPRDASMSGRDTEDPEAQSSNDMFNGQARKRKHSGDGESQLYNSAGMDNASGRIHQGTLSAAATNDRLPELHYFKQGTPAGQQTPKSRQTSPEGSLRRSGRKRRKISNYKRLIDVGAATSSDDNV